MRIIVIDTNEQNYINKEFTKKINHKITIIIMMKLLFYIQKNSINAIFFLMLVSLRYF